MLPGDRATPPRRTGNWCPFEQKRVVTKAVKCTTPDKHVVKSESPCPSGAPDCRVTMYKMSPRTYYKLEQSIQTDVLWGCCPGYAGTHCENRVPDVRRGSVSPPLIGGSEARRTPEDAGVHTTFGDPNREQNDHQPSAGELLDVSYPDHTQQDTTVQPTPDPGYASNPHYTPHTHSPHYTPHPRSPHRTPHPHSPHHTQHRPADRYDHEHSIHHPPHLATDFYDHDHSYHHQHDPTADSHDARPQHPPHRTTESHDNTPRQDIPPPVIDVDAAPLPIPDAPSALPVPHMMALVLSQLQPVLQGFNRSLEQLSRQVADLTRELKDFQVQAELQEELNQQMQGSDEERLEFRLQEVSGQVKEVQRLMEEQRSEMENRLHAHHSMLHYNLTSFKVDVDMKLKRHQKMLQTSLQDLNATLAGMNQDRDQDRDQDQDQGDVPQIELDYFPPPSQPDTSALWEAIDRLDKKVVNNTVKVDGLMEDLDVTSGSVQQLRQEVNEVTEQMNQTARSTQVQYMLTGLEVEAAREAVLGRVEELAGNLNNQAKKQMELEAEKVAVLQRVEELASNLNKQAEKQLELDNDVDYLWNGLNRSNSSSDCNCGTLSAAVAQLERGVANVTELASKNRLTLDEGDGVMVGEGDWELAVQEVQRKLQKVEETLDSEKARTRTVEFSLSQLRDSASVTSSEVFAMKEVNERVEGEMVRLTGSFRSLLKDSIRYSDVLELLLGEDVLEFLEWPVQDQEGHSIPTLKEQLRLLQEKIHPSDEEPSADQPSSSWLPGPIRKSSDEAPARERQLLLRPERRPPPLPPGQDGGDLWNLERTVEELRLKLLRLEEKHHNITEKEAQHGGAVEAKLQAEVTWLKRGLEEHLRVFKNVFSNADVLAAKDATLELDKLWMLVKNKEKKRGGAGGGAAGGKEVSGRGNHRSRREATGVPVLSGLSEASLLFLASSPRSVSHGDVAFTSSLDRGHFDAGVFTAPTDGLYLFILTMHLQPGPAHLSLRRSGGVSGGVGGVTTVPLQQGEVKEAGPVTSVSLLLLREGEELRPHLRGGKWAESEDNVFAGLLLHRTT